MVAEEPIAAAGKARIFISYSRKDSAFADRIDDALKARGFDPLIDRADIYAFEAWWTRIENLITQSDTVVFILSPDAVASAVALKEVAFAASLNKRFAPIVCRAVEPNAVPEALARLNFIHFDQEANFDAALHRLVDALETDIDWIRKHTELSALAHRWAEAGRPGPKGLLLRSPILDDAERWIATRPQNAPSPTEEVQALVAESRRAATRRQQTVAGLSLAAALVALSLAGLAYWQRATAVEQRNEAVTQRRLAQISESHFRAQQADAARAEGDAASAMLLALEGLPDANAADPVRRDRPYVPEVERALLAAWNAWGERVILAGHTGVVTSTAFSPDGRYVVTASDDNTARIWNASTGELIAVLKGHLRSVENAVYSPDGRTIVTASSDGTARLWDDQGRVITVLVGHTATVWSATFSRDGRRILTRSVDQTARLWDTDGNLLATLSGHRANVDAAIISPDGSLIVTRSPGITLLWSGDGTLIRELPSSLHVAFAPDSRRLLASRSTTAVLLDRDGHTIAELTGHTGIITSVRFSEDGQHLLTTSQDRTARLWDADGRALRSLPHAGGVETALFSSDGALVLTISATARAGRWFHAAHLWQLDGTPVDRLAHDNLVRMAAFSSDGRKVVTASSDTARIWEAGIRPAQSLFRHRYAVSKLSLSPDGDRILSVSGDLMTRLSQADGTLLKEFVVRDRLGNMTGFSSASFSPDGTRVLTSGSDKRVRIWTADGSQIASLEHAHFVKDAQYSPDGKLIVVASEDKNAHLWDAQGTPIRTFTGHDGAVNSAVFSSSGRHILTASDDHTARLWTLDGKSMIILKGHGAPVRMAAFSRDGASIITTSWKDNELRIWRADGSLIRTIKVSGGVYGAVFSPDGQRIVTGHQDGRARLWSATGTLLATHAWHRSNVFAAIFSPDGRFIYTASSDWSVQRWEVSPSTQALIDRVKDAIPRCLTPPQQETLAIATLVPDWCIERRKWPYDTPQWRQWLSDKRSGKNPAPPAI